MLDDQLRLAVDLVHCRPLRGDDAEQLAAALDLDRHLRHAGLPAVTFVAADAALCRAAAAEGLTVVDAAAVR